MTVQWPAFLKFAEEAELLVVSNEEEWRVDHDLSGISYGKDDRLVDSNGKEFVLEFVGERNKGEARPVPTGVAWRPEVVRATVESHMIAVGARVEGYLEHLAAVSPGQWVQASIQYLEGTER